MQGGATLPLREAANKLIDGGKKPVEAASKLITSGKKPVEAAASWVTHIKDAINVTRKRPQAANESVKAYICPLPAFRCSIRNHGAHIPQLGSH